MDKVCALEGEIIRRQRNSACCGAKQKAAPYQLTDVSCVDSGDEESTRNEVQQLETSQAKMLLGVAHVFLGTNQTMKSLVGQSARKNHASTGMGL